MALPAHIESVLAKVEICFNDVSAALVSGEPIALEAASAALRQAAIDFSGLFDGLADQDRNNPGLVARLAKIGSGLAAQRESLIRRTALVDLALNTLVPATRTGTYSKSAGPNNGSYGSPVKQTGAFKVLSA